MLEEKLKRLDTEVFLLRYALWVVQTTPRERAIYYNRRSRKHYRAR